MVVDCREESASAAATGVRVIVNVNASGSGRGPRPQELAAWFEAAGAATDVVATASLAELEEVWAGDDERRLVLVGGDGTVHAAANLPGPAREIALIPTGRANNVARCLGIPLDWRRAAQLALSGRVRPVDLIEARAGERLRLVVEGVSVGFLAQARVRYHGRNSADLVEGLRAGLTVLRHFHPLGARVVRPGGQETLHLAQLFVANLPLYEFGLRVTPRADPSDGHLDMVGIEAAGRLGVLRMLMDLRRGTHLGRPGVHHWRADRIVIETHGRSPVVADSTDLGFGPVELRVAPSALRIVRP